MATHLPRLRRSLALMLSLRLLASGAGAHPGGHFGIMQHSRLVVDAGGVSLSYRLHLGEMLTLGLTGELGGDDKVPPPVAVVEAYRAARAAAWMQHLAVRLDGQPLAMAPAGGSSRVERGLGTFSTLRFELQARASWGTLAPGPHRLEFRDDNFAEVAGHRTVLLRAAPDVLVESASVPSHDTLPLLAQSSEAGTGPAPDVREASAVFALRAPADLARAPLASGGLFVPRPSVAGPLACALAALLSAALRVRARMSLSGSTLLPWTMARTSTCDRSAE